MAQHHSFVSHLEGRRARIAPDLVGVSVGLERIEELVADPEQAQAAV